MLWKSIPFKTWITETVSKGVEQSKQVQGLNSRKASANSLWWRRGGGCLLGNWGTGQGTSYCGLWSSLGHAELEVSIHLATLEFPQDRDAAPWDRSLPPLLEWCCFSDQEQPPTCLPLTLKVDELAEHVGLLACFVKHHEILIYLIPLFIQGMCFLEGNKAELHTHGWQQHR